jgi:hypothetical protein
VEEPPKELDLRGKLGVPESKSVRVVRDVALEGQIYICVFGAEGAVRRRSPEASVRAISEGYCLETCISVMAQFEIRGRSWSEKGE